MKTEPDVFSIDDLIVAPNQTTCWDGVRNYQARNFMRDRMKLGDRALIYHSNADPSCVVGIAMVCKVAYPDHSAWNPSDPHFDPKSTPQNPRWFMVDIRFESKFERRLVLSDLRKIRGLESMELLRKGSRLSVQPVTKTEFDIIVSQGNPQSIKAKSSTKRSQISRRANP
jgi:predicted RNA-binding protein with PUA-like domain